MIRQATEEKCGRRTGPILIIASPAGTVAQLVAGLTYAGHTGRPRVPLHAVLIDDVPAAWILAGAQDGLSQSCVREAVSAATIPGMLDNLQTAVTRGSQTRLDSDEPTAAEVDTLRLLAQGMTQTAIARKLKRSERTIRRRVDRAYAKLGAVSSFQAGHLATLRGWI